MPRGKKFDAAEKHFMEERRKYDALIKYYQERCKQLTDENAQLSVKVSDLEYQNDQLNQWVQRLLHYTEMSLDDVKAACERDESIRRTAEKMFKVFEMTSL